MRVTIRFNYKLFKIIIAIVFSGFMLKNMFESITLLAWFDVMIFTIAFAISFLGVFIIIAGE